jgi:4-aminobutyrate aminotransferase-like enzyme/Ser/Thr protein kinase RdoA (MazF antagonist)
VSFGVADAAALLDRRWGLAGTSPRPIGGFEDDNFLVEAGGDRFVLKVTGPDTTLDEAGAQARGMVHLAGAGLPFATPTPVAAGDGGLAIEIDLDGDRRVARLLTWVPGRPLASWRHLAPVVLGSLGEVAGRVAGALEGFDDPALDRRFAWDCRRAPEVVHDLASSVPSTVRRDLALAVADRVDAALAPLTGALRVQAIHADVTDLNVIAAPGRDGRPVPTGLIDLGDLSLGWVAAEVAVAACSAVPHDPDRALGAVVDVVRGFHRVCPLTEPEVEALWWLVLGRAAVLATTTEHQAALDPGNEYVTSSIEREWANLAASWTIPAPVAHEALRLALDLGPSEPARSVPAGARPVVDLPAGPVLDLSVTGDLLAPGSWLDPDAVAATVAHAGVAAVGRHGEGRLPAAGPGQAEPATVSLGAELACPAGTPVVSPSAATVRASEQGRVVLACAGGIDVVLRGLTPAVAGGDAVEPGTVVGHVVAHPPGSAWPSHVHVVAVAAGLDPPPAVPGSLAPAWLALCADPSPLLGVAPGAAVAPGTDPAELLARRSAVLAGVQEHYWSAPPVIERGWRTSLHDASGRPYLDAVNNVAVLGHSHPAVAAAVARGLRLLNTNSRFHYEAIVAYAERLAGLLPEPLDTVFLVSTGSEACDLALRLVRAATGREDVLALEGAYHGWTMATDAVSTSLHDNPSALGTRPPWVHLVAAPDTYRGRFRDGDAGARYADDVGRVLADLAGAGRQPAGFIAEPLAGNAGGLVFPEGYLRSAYDQVRAEGGLCIADEVQTGLGRLGDWFWAFESQGVVPDVVTVAKAAGNGVPVGAVVTSAAVAAAFASEGSFFSSVGGSPVSAAAGLAVLDAIEAEGLQANAAAVGAHLRRRLEALVERFDLCGAVHGHGLYLGLELVRHPETREPAGAEASAICERALALGLVVQPTGDGANVLKIKPPLCLSEADADHLAAVLERILTDGW